ncbi:zincin-like metallopeptidase domain-containing protein [Aurantibacter aestuarii]|uniref:Antirestriction protein ArdC n=1 Tax=Aurantibacter aestuarii TaxID=1266046 RepID=A0A2T1NEJ3_9FLAO|nr:zincin-like metallopeptidase domain-containing protein [Aurantibacter aestuarii]PSG90868.1 hypothetical protein C7H52_06235 [Aurantibacter aestuarii]
MLNSISKYNSLNGAINREDLIELCEQLKTDEQFFYSNKIKSLLEKNPDAKKFEIETINKAFEIPSKDVLSGLAKADKEDEDFGLAKAVSPSEIYDMITKRMLNLIKEASGTGYKKKWKAKAYGTGYLIPFNFDSKKRYRGVNVFLLSTFEPLPNPFFLTFKQIEKHNGKLKKGSKGSPVVYFTVLYKIQLADRNIDFGTYNAKKASEFAKKNNINPMLIQELPILKYYNVFNGSDIENIDFDLDNFKIGYIEEELPTSKNNKVLEIPEAIIENYPKPAPSYSFGGDKASFSPMRDLIKMPHLVDFETPQDYYRTFLHELSHSTGLASRLDRDFTGRFGSKKYAFEELIAEWGAVFLSAEAGIIFHNNKNHAEYIKNWNSVLTHIKDDNKFVMRACTQAQKLTDFILQYDENGNPKYLESLKASAKEKKEPEPVKKATIKASKKIASKLKQKKTKVDENGQYGLFGANKQLNFSTEDFKKMTVSELREFLKTYYETHLKGKKIPASNFLKNIEFVSKAKGKLLKPIYSEKVVVVKKIEELIKSSTYNNFGNPKPTDKKDVLGYLNFKSKVVIDNKQRHVRISIVLYKNRETHFKTYEIGKTKKESDKSPDALVISKTSDGGKISLSKNKNTKKSNSVPKNNLKKGLNGSLSNRSNNQQRQFFELLPEHKDLQDFLGKVEIQEHESAVMTLSAPAGSGKTTAVFKMMNAFSESGYKTLFASLEEHPESYLFEKKADQFLSDKAKELIYAPNYSRENINDFLKDIENADVIFVDSMKKLWQYLKGFDLDNDLRKKFKGKLFVIIFQLTSSGKMRGGSDAEFDGDIITFIEKENDFTENYLYHDKNRYATTPIHETKLNVASFSLIDENSNAIPLKEINYEIV